LIEVWLIDERFKVVQHNPSKVGDSKKYFISIFTEFPFTSMKIYLALKNECMQFIRAAPTKRVWFLHTAIPLFLGRVCLPGKC